ncbi:MAG: hypothetical protein AB7I19_18180 [Planctomycetota bacterium]
MARSLLLAVAFAATSALATAQTFVVDAANGPGTNFTDLPPAVAAVPDGAVLLVRTGTYGPVQLDGKGLSILATAPQVRTWGVAVVNLAVGQAFTLRGVEVIGVGSFASTPPQTPWAQVYLRACAGPVILQAVSCQQRPDFTSVYAGDCSALTIRESVLDGSVWARNSQVAVESTDVFGCWETSSGAAARPGIVVEGGTVTTARSRVTGGGVGWGGVLFPAYAVELWSGAELRLCEDSSGAYAGGQVWPNPTPTPAIGGFAGTRVVRTPEAVLTGGAAVGGTTDIVLPMPSLHTQPAGPGGTVVADITTPVGEIVLLALSLPGPVTAVPGVEGRLWVDAATAVLLTGGVPQPGVPLRHAIHVPNMPSLVAARLCCQAIAWSPIDGLRLSNASTLSL